MATAKQIIGGLEVLSKYGETNIAAEHDIFYAGTSVGAELKEKDKKILEELGWFYEEEFESWARFV